MQIIIDRFDYHRYEHNFEIDGLVWQKKIVY